MNIFNFGNDYVFWVAFVMKEDVSINPLDIGLLYAIGGMLETDGITDSIKHFLGGDHIII
jgi:hypothetical protein